MASLQNSIGNFNFDSLQGSISLPQDKVEVYTRPGSDGYGSRRRGVKPDKTVLRSVIYVADFQAAMNLFDDYGLLPGQDPVTVYQHGVDVGRFLVVKVTKASIKPCYNAVGTLVADPFARMVCNWELYFNAYP